MKSTPVSFGVLFFTVLANESPAKPGVPYSLSPDAWHLAPETQTSRHLD
jgi:hypothetical protein